MAISLGTSPRYGFFRHHDVGARCRLICEAMTTRAAWVSGARPRTLPAAVVPVAVGMAVVAGETGVDAGRVVLHGGFALVVSLALQVAVNYANDYSDGVRGTDDYRQGPMRLVASGAASAAAVKRAAIISFAVAGVFGLVLAARTSWWLLAVGVVCMAAGWTYTGGPKPYGYLGLGEVFVFVFFGLVATAGTVFVIVEQVTRLALVSGAVAGFLAVALLMVNNIRDIDNDRTSGKVTLAVRLGPRRARSAYSLMFVAAAVAMVVAAFDEPLAALGLVGLLAALPAISTVRAARSTADLVRALGMTARAQLVVGVLYAVGLVIQ
jgi:1,4-dihydroxy-2-naphthoate polyprenyltransferase